MENGTHTPTRNTSETSDSSGAPSTLLFTWRPTRVERTLSIVKALVMIGASVLAIMLILSGTGPAPMVARVVMIGGLILLDAFSVVNVVTRYVNHFEIHGDAESVWATEGPIRLFKEEPEITSIAAIRGVEAETVRGYRGSIDELVALQLDGGQKRYLYNFYYKALAEDVAKRLQAHIEAVRATRGTGAS